MRECSERICENLYQTVRMWECCSSLAGFLYTWWSGTVCGLMWNLVSLAPALAAPISSLMTAISAPLISFSGPLGLRIHGSSSFYPVLLLSRLSLVWPFRSRLGNHDSPRFREPNCISRYREIDQVPKSILPNGTLELFFNLGPWWVALVQGMSFLDLGPGYVLPWPRSRVYSSWITWHRYARPAVLAWLKGEGRIGALGAFRVLPIYDTNNIILSQSLEGRFATWIQRRSLVVDRPYFYIRYHELGLSLPRASYSTTSFLIPSIAPSGWFSHNIWSPCILSILLGINAMV
jgi:hypothetical protein